MIRRGMVRLRPAVAGGMTMAALRWRRWRSGTLTTAGLAALVAAGFTLSTLAGLIVTGLSLFVLEWLTGE